MPRPNRNDSPDVKLSKGLSFILRHGAAKEKVPIRPDGFVLVADLLKKDKFKAYSLQDIGRVVRENEKKRFSMVKKQVVEQKDDKEQLQDDGIPFEEEIAQSTPTDWYIRANQGHSLKTIQVDLKPLKSLQDFPAGEADSSHEPVAVHGTNLRAWELIQKSGGLSRMNRTHIHMAPGLFGEDHVVSGMRKSADVYVYIDISKALEANIPFWLSSNGVILSEGNQQGLIPSYLFKSVKHRNRTTNELVDIEIGSQLPTQ